MTHRTASLLLMLAAAAGLLGPGIARAESDPDRDAIRYETPGEIPLLHPSYGTGTAVAILVTDDRVSPRRARIGPGQTVVWRSMARQGSRIVFEREVARSMICNSLVNFELDGDSLRSAPLQTGDTSSFCRLAPGRYRYRVERNGPAEQATPGAMQLSSRLEGVLVVEAGPEAMAAR